MGRHDYVTELMWRNDIKLHKRLLLILNCTILGKSADRTLYHYVIPGSALVDEEFYVAIYCIGEIEVDEKRQINFYFFTRIEYFLSLINVM